MGNIIGPVIRSLIHERHSSLLTVAKNEKLQLVSSKMHHCPAVVILPIVHIIIKVTQEC